MKMSSAKDGLNNSLEKCEKKNIASIDISPLYGSATQEWIWHLTQQQSRGAA
jgi:hypothetical protein